MRALRPYGAETDPAPSRTQDAPQEQAQQEDVRQAGDPSYVGLCPPCHRHIHVAIPNKELEREYNTIEALKAHPGIERFVEWVRDKPHGTLTADARHVGQR